MKLMHDLQKKKQVMLIEQIEQQKKLIHKLENSKSMKPEEKEELMKLIKTLQESIEAIKKGMEVTTHHQNRTKPQALHSQTQAPQPNQPLPGVNVFLFFCFLTLDYFIFSLGCTRHS